MNRGILIVLCLLVAGGVGAWAAGVFDGEKADATSDPIPTPVNETGGVTADQSGGGSSCGGCPSMGGGLSVVDEGGGCPAGGDSVLAVDAPAAMSLPCDGCGKSCDEETCKDCTGGDCSDKSSCGGGGCADKGACGGGGCAEKGACGGGGGDDCPGKAGCGGGCDKEKAADGQ